jgi:hypothetical protein
MGIWRISPTNLNYPQPLGRIENWNWAIIMLQVVKRQIIQIGDDKMIHYLKYELNLK